MTTAITKTLPWSPYSLNSLNDGLKEAFKLRHTAAPETLKSNDLLFCSEDKGFLMDPSFEHRAKGTSAEAWIILNPSGFTNLVVPRRGFAEERRLLDPWFMVLCIFLSGLEEPMLVTSTIRPTTSTQPASESNPIGCSVPRGISTLKADIAELEAVMEGENWKEDIVKGMCHMLFGGDLAELTEEGSGSFRMLSMVGTLSSFLSGVIWAGAMMRDSISEKGHLLVTECKRILHEITRIQLAYLEQKDT